MIFKGDLMIFSLRQAIWFRGRGCLQSCLRSLLLSIQIRGKICWRCQIDMRVHPCQNWHIHSINQLKTQILIKMQIWPSKTRAYMPKHHNMTTDRQITATIRITQHKIQTKTTETQTPVSNTIGRRISIQSSTPVWKNQHLLPLISNLTFKSTSKAPDTKTQMRSFQSERPSIWKNWGGEGPDQWDGGSTRSTRTVPSRGKERKLLIHTEHRICNNMIKSPTQHHNSKVPSLHHIICLHRFVKNSK